MATQILVQTGSGNGLLPGGTKPLPEPILTIITGVLCHSLKTNFTGSAGEINSRIEFEICTFPRGQRVNDEDDYIDDDSNGDNAIDEDGDEDDTEMMKMMIIMMKLQQNNTVQTLCIIPGMYSSYNA